MRKLILVIIIFSTVTVNSQQLLSLEEAISYGLQHNYNIQIAENQNKIANQNKAKGLAGFLPQIDFTGSAMSVGNETETDTSLVNSDIQSLKAELSLNWTLFDGFRMFANKKMFDELAEMTSFQTKDKIEQTIVSIAQSYFNIIQQEKLLDASLKSKEISELRLKREKIRNSIGGASSTDFFKAQVAFNIDHTNLLKQKTNAQLAYEQLNILLGRDPLVQFVVEKEIRIKELKLSHNEIIKKALDANSSLKMAELQKKIANRKVQLAKAVFYPRVGLAAGYALNDQTRNSTIGDFTSPDFTTKTNDATIGLVLSFNLFNGQKDKVDLSNAKIEKKNQELAYRDVQNRLKGYISEVFSKYKQQEEIVALEQHNIKSAEQNLVLQQERNRLGVANSLEFRDAQLSLYKAQTSLISAQFQTAVYRLEIERITGILSK